MACVTICTIKYCELSSLGFVLKALPDSTRLCLHDSDDLDDAGLQLPSLCTHLEQLELMCMNNVTPSGISTLLEIHGKQLYVECSNCDRVRKPEMAQCELLLRSKGFDVRMSSYP